MTAKWHRYILWNVLSLCLLSCALDTYASPLHRRRKVLKQGTPRSKAIKQSGRSPPASTSAPPLGSRRPLETPWSKFPGEPEERIQSDLASQPDVSVTCATTDFVVRVKPSFYGHGAEAKELKLGRKCKSNGVVLPRGDLLFTYPLTACDAVREASRDHLRYKFLLHYEPSPKRFPNSTHRIHVDIECRYERNHHVYQLAVQPTWATIVARKKLKGNPSDFQMVLMDDLWSRPVEYQVYQIGKIINFQVSAPHLSTGKLYIDTCYATPSLSSLRHAIVDNFGCMLDGKRDPGASQFISRTDNALRFSFKTFQFKFDPDAVVNIHCKLFVSSEDPGPTRKSCTYRENRWKALAGDDSICECCDSQCGRNKPQLALMEGSTSSGSFVVSDHPYKPKDEFPPISRESDAPINRNAEPKGHENLWRSTDLVKYDEDDDDEEDYDDDDDDDDDDEEEEDDADEEIEEDSGLIFGATAGPDLDDSGLRARALMESEEDGSEYVVQEETEEDEMTLKRKESALRHWVEEITPSEENSKRRREEDDWKNDDLDEDDDDDGEMTWYFTWGR